jgi:hypothetical protein
MWSAATAARDAVWGAGSLAALAAFVALPCEATYGALRPVARRDVVVHKLLQLLSSAPILPETWTSRLRQDYCSASDDAQGEELRQLLGVAGAAEFRRGSVATVALLDGVAVKVILDETRREVLKCTAALASIAGVLRRAGQRGLAHVLDVFASDLQGQLDLEREAERMRRAREELLLLQESSGVARRCVVPEVLSASPGALVMRRVDHLARPAQESRGLREELLFCYHALCCATQGHVHLDLHPGNAALCVEQGEEKLVLYDWGSSMCQEGELLEFQKCVFRRDFQGALAALFGEEAHRLPSSCDFSDLELLGSATRLFHLAMRLEDETQMKMRDCALRVLMGSGHLVSVVCSLHQGDSSSPLLLELSSRFGQVHPAIADFLNTPERLLKTP